MRTHGVKQLDPVHQTRQLDWLVLPARQCPDPAAEQRIVAVHFRVPHEPWGPELAFVLPVTVRRSRRRVLFVQHSGTR
jgi:hypothetical protein